MLSCKQCKHQKRQLRICIEGGIGAGKTFLCNRLMEFFRDNMGVTNITILREMIDTDLLHKFNAQPKKYGLLFQQSMSKGRLRMLENAWRLFLEASKKDEEMIILIDTGILREYAFTKANQQMGRMTDADADYHLTRFERCLRSSNEKILKEHGLKPSDIHQSIIPDVTILLNVPASFCRENIIKRKRDNEDLLSIDYLQCINEQHNTQIDNLPSFSDDEKEETSDDEEEEEEETLEALHITHEHVFNSDGYVNLNDVVQILFK